MAENELSLLGRLAHWLESQGASVRSTHFTYEEGQASLKAVIDMERTEVTPREGAKELAELLIRAEAALKLKPQALPSTLEIMAHNMAQTVMKLKRMSRGRGPDYYFDLFKLLEEERKDE